MRITKLPVGTLILMILLFCSDYFLFNKENDVLTKRAVFQSLLSGIIFFIIMFLPTKRNNNES